MANTKDWFSSRRSRLLSWCLGLLVFVLIIYSPPSKTRHERPSGGVVPPRLTHPPVDVPIRKPLNKQRPAEPAKHAYRPDGLLDVNPKGKHPILELIERSETQWKRRLERQSKTLEEAVDEYKRRYNRLPPTGFEKWYVIRRVLSCHAPQCVQVALC